MVHPDWRCRRFGYVLHFFLAPRLTTSVPEKALVKLRKQQRDKIEEVKQKTNYYSMRNLIERYEGGPGPDSPGLRRRIPQTPQAQPPIPSPIPQQPQQLAPQTPQRVGLQVNPQTPAQGTLTPGLQQQLSRE